MIILQLILFCALFTLMVKLAVRNDALNALYFYPKPVQERVYELCLTDRETVARKRKRYPHCGYMAAETAEYVKQIEEFMKA